MARWMLTAVLTATLANGAFAEAEIITLKTAGQPDRRVQVLKTERTPDGKTVQEVRDLASGVVFTLTDTKSLPATAAGTTMLPGTQVPSANLPLAKPRAGDPLLGSKPVATAQTPADVPNSREYPSLLGKLRGPKDAAPAAGFTAPLPATQGTPPQSKISAALFGSYENQKTQNPTLVGSVRQKPITAPTMSASAETPTLANKLFGDKPQPIVAQPVQAAKTNVIRPNAVAMTTPVPPPPAAKFVAVAPPPMEPQMELVPVKLDTREPVFPVPPMKTMNLKQIEDLVKDLRTNARPTTRLEAADALAASPMAGMLEVRQILAEASYRDPVPVVRAHCIEILTKMSYDENNYRQYVSGLMNDDEPAVQRAARAAVR